MFSRPSVLNFMTPLAHVGVVNNIIMDYGSSIECGCSNGVFDEQVVVKVTTTKANLPFHVAVAKVRQSTGGHALYVCIYLSVYKYM